MRASATVAPDAQIEGGANKCVAIDGTIAYTNFGYYLTALDISDPTTPRKISNLLLPNRSQDLTLGGGYLYAAAADSGLRVINLADPSRLEEVASLKDVDPARIAIEDDKLYVAGFDDSLEIVDISDPKNPENVGAVGLPSGLFANVAVEGGFAYFVNSSGFYVVDVGVPFAPVVVASLPFGSGSIVIVNDIAYISGLRAIDISDPTNPIDLGVVSECSAQDMAVSGSRLYLAEGFYDRLTILDITDPLLPTELGSANLLGSEYRVAVSGSVACVATKTRGLNLVDVSDPSAASMIGHYETFYFALGTKRFGDYLHVLGLFGWAIFDLADPGNPRHVFFDPTGGETDRIAFSGAYAYVPVRMSCCAGWSFFITYAMSDPTNPIPVDSDQLSDYSEIYDIETAGDLLHVVDYDGLYIFDISNRADPAPVGFIPLVGQISAQDNYVYDAAGSAGFKIYDVTDPGSPSQVGGISLGHAQDVDVVGDFAYVVCSGVDALRIVDVSDKAHPVEVGRLADPLGASLVSVSGIYAYLTSAYEDVQVIDVSNKTNPVKVGSLETGGVGGHASVKGAWVYAASYAYNGVHMGEIYWPTAVHNSSPKVLDLTQNYPNPFNPSTTIEFSLSESDLVDLTVFDIHGRHVVTVLHERLPSGDHQITWDGRRGNGDEVVSGVYFCRLKG
ncbi:MAG: T9SS type A sorting domain-containing protein, partial [Candidatus Latescibacterota bacterium]